jgi:hypothetical protein
MHATLHSILRPLILGANTGIITVVSEYGPQGIIHLKNGLLVGVETENLTGAAAAAEVAEWVSISTEFTAGIDQDLENPDAFDHMGFINLLAGRDKKINAIRKVIPENEARYKILVENWQTKKITVKQLMLITKLDGRHSVRQVVAESGVAELEVLSFIHGLYSDGMVKEINSPKAMKKEDIDNFLDALMNKLQDLVGPAAEATIQKAFESLGIDPDLLAKSQIAEVLEWVAEHLDEMESEVFSHWKNGYSRELRKPVTAHGASAVYRCANRG